MLPLLQGFSTHPHNLMPQTVSCTMMPPSPSPSPHKSYRVTTIEWYVAAAAEHGMAGGGRRKAVTKAWSLRWATQPQEKALWRVLHFCCDPKWCYSALLCLSFNTVSGFFLMKDLQSSPHLLSIFLKLFTDNSTFLWISWTGVFSLFFFLTDCL